MKRIFCSVLPVLMLFFCLAGCSPTESTALPEEEKRTVQDFQTARIGVVTGTLQAVLLPKLLPDAEYTEFNTNTDAAMALATGKIDTFSVSESVYLAMRWEGQDVAYIDDPLDVGAVGMLFGRGIDPQLQKDFNSFLAACGENGTLERLKEKWFNVEEPEEMPDYADLQGTTDTLLIGLAATQKPYTYIKNGRFAGFDVELLSLFAKEYGYGLEFEEASFGGLLNGIEQGRYDMVCSGVSITEERQQSMDFSDPYYEEALVLVVRGANSDADRTLDAFQNATLGVIDGSLYDGYSRTLFPQAEIDSYPSFTDLFQCVKQGKIDGFLIDIPNYNAVSRSETNLSYINVPGYSVDVGFAFGKDGNGELLQAQMNDLLTQLREDGTFDALWEKWCGDEEPLQPVAVPDLSDNTKELNIALDLSRKPFVYLLNNAYAGFEVEVLYLFCEAYGYAPSFSSVQWTSGVAGLKEGKYDMLSCGIYMTEERKESVNFSDPYVSADVVMVTYDAGEATGVFASLQDSFEKTFVREDRWKLIVEGTVVTLIISFFSVLGGTAFGFGLYLLARSSCRAVSAAAKAAARVYARLVAGTPALVILMLLFYVVFGRSDLSGIVVAIIGFLLIFGAFVYGHLTLTVEGVDPGQTEAAYALGYTRNQAFFRIVLPQAMKAFLPTYSAEIVGLIKATAVVGYIAVSDLTKMGDIIRSNTYEALFPLITVAVIYFILTWGAAALLGLVQKRMDAHRRKDKNILKGVVR